ncbi:MAG: zinc-ribbon domain-containing protein [Wujia sp.]
MNCPNCGAEIPEGITFCSSCGTSIQSQPSVQPAFDMGAAPYQTTPSVAPKKKAPIGAIIGVVVALIAIVCVVFFVILKGGKYDGEYKLIEMTYMGITYDEATIAQAGQELTLTIKGSSCDLEGEAAKIKISGDEVEVTDSVGTYKGTYDKSEKTITLDVEGIIMVFKKQ